MLTSLFRHYRMRPESTIKQRTAYFLFLLIGTRFFRFCGTGVIGFTVDAGILSILTKLGHLPTIPSRGLSFSVAVVVTWALNRRWTFCASTRPSCREFLAYIASQGVGLGVNFGIFSLLIISQAPLVGRPLPALGLSSLFALTINYAGLRIFAFPRSAAAGPDVLSHNAGNDERQPPKMAATGMMAGSIAKGKTCGAIVNKRMLTRSSRGK